MKPAITSPAVFELGRVLIWHADSRIKKLAAQAAAELSRQQKHKKP